MGASQLVPARGLLMEMRLQESEWKHPQDTENGKHMEKRKGKFLPLLSPVQSGSYTDCPRGRLDQSVWQKGLCLQWLMSLRMIPSVQSEKGQQGPIAFCGRKKFYLYIMTWMHPNDWYWKGKFLWMTWWVGSTECHVPGEVKWRIHWVLLDPGASAGSGLNLTTVTNHNTSCMGSSWKLPGTSAHTLYSMQHCTIGIFTFSISRDGFDSLLKDTKY